MHRAVFTSLLSGLLDERITKTNHRIIQCWRGVTFTMKHRKLFSMILLVILITGMLSINAACKNNIDNSLTNEQNASQEIYLQDGYAVTVPQISVHESDATNTPQMSSHNSNQQENTTDNYEWGRLPPKVTENLPNELYITYNSSGNDRWAAYLQVYSFDLLETTEFQIDIDVRVGDISVSIMHEDITELVFDEKEIESIKDTVILNSGAYSVFIRGELYNGYIHLWTVNNNQTMEYPVAEPTGYQRGTGTIHQSCGN